MKGNHELPQIVTVPKHVMHTFRRILQAEISLTAAFLVQMRKNAHFA